MNLATVTRRGRITAGTAGLVLALAACGGSTTSDAATPAVSSAGSGFAAYRACMAENGVTLPDMGAPPSGQPEAVDRATFDAASNACADLAPAPGAGMGPDGGGASAPDASALAAFKGCLTSHDVTIASGDDWMAGLDRTDATVAAAFRACDPLLPSAAPTP